MTGTSLHASPFHDTHASGFFQAVPGTAAASWQQTKSRRSGSSPISSAKCASSSEDSRSASSARRGKAWAWVRSRRTAPYARLRAVQPAGRVFRHAAARPGFQGLHERGPNDFLDEVEPAHAERPGQHGAEPAELVAKKVLH